MAGVFLGIFVFNVSLSALNAAVYAAERNPVNLFATIVCGAMALLNLVQYSGAKR